MSIESIKELQNNIYLLNESCNKRKLMIPKSKDTNFNLFNQLKLFFEKLTLTSFTTSKDVLHPNLISFLVDNNICSVKRKIEKNKCECYLESKCTDHGPSYKVYISKQIYFGYMFVEKLKKYSKKKHMKNFFDEDNNIINLKMEEWTRTWNGVKNTRRLDFVLDIGNDRKIVIEYLEDHHINELRDWNIYQTIRLVDILFGDMKDSIVHFAFIWDKNYDSKYLKNKAKNISNIIKNFHDIDNEKDYTISILNEQFKNKSFSKIIYESYFNENKTIINLDLLLSKIFPSFIKEKIPDLKNKIINVSDQMKANNSNEDIFSDSEDDSEEETLDESIEEIIYYSKINNKILLSNHGLSLFLNLCTINDFENINDFRSCINLINKISKSAYTSAIKIRELILRQKENIISGLDEIN